MRNVTQLKMDCWNMSESKDEPGSFNVELNAIYDADPNSPNHVYWKYTPCGTLNLQGLKGKFNLEQGKRYIVDIYEDNEQRV